MCAVRHLAVRHLANMGNNETLLFTIVNAVLDSLLVQSHT